MISILVNYGDMYSLRKQPTSREVATCALAKRRLSNERRNSILMTCHYPDLGCASDWLKHTRTSFQPIRSTTKIWVVTHHQYGISALVTQTSFCEGSSGDLAKCRLFSQAKTCIVVLSFEPVDELLRCDHSNEISLVVILHGTICFAGFEKMKFNDFLKFFLNFYFGYY